MKSWDEVAKDQLVFPIGGKTYVIPELPYQAMLTIEKSKAGLKTELDDADPAESWRIVMGSAYDEMVADNVPAEALMRAGLATHAFFEHGREMAESIWESGIDPKAVAEALQRASEGSTPSPSTAKATSTRKRASTTGTTSRKATPRAKPRTAARKAT